jgi:hypothetical protein
MADQWLVVWSSFSPSIPASKRKLRPQWNIGGTLEIRGLRSIL